jgi:hypothetical protein
MYNISQKDESKGEKMTMCSSSLADSFPYARLFSSSSGTCRTSPSLHLSSHLKQTRASALNSLHLGLAVHRPPETLRQLIAIPELAVLGLHAAQLSRSAAADTTKSLRRSLGSSAAAAGVVAAHHGAVLAGFLAVGGEGLGEGFGR